MRAPHRAHLDILAELSLDSLIQTEEVHSFDTLHEAWEGVLNTEALNRKFYGELHTWYQWAVAECRFPDNTMQLQVIRLITRLLFIWFLKEKKLVPEELFEEEPAANALNRFSPETSDYYQAVLQNLFFATLNTPISERAFSPRNYQGHRDASKYRYEDLLNNPEAFLEHLKQVPFVNGGLFDCLDTFEGTRAGGTRVDCFTDDINARRKLHVPAKLFFDKKAGLFPLFAHYKFTVEENTPIEQEVALDPELLGQVFENLLGVYNPETQSTARKATGSYYTPRQIVDYMVDEALIAYFLQKVAPFDGDRQFLEERLRDDLLAYEAQGNADEPNTHLIHEAELEPMIAAIDALKIIDPAVGSGAFPMGILNKLVLILQKLDPQNAHWKELQLRQAETIPDLHSREEANKGIENVFSAANRYNDYGRKLYLIQNCIYGVDIQPIAITIAKLRFFISLIIEQVPNENREDNYGIRPLPNLEIKFVSANTLIGLRGLKDADFQLLLETDTIQRLRQEIEEIRAKHFSASTRQQKQAATNKADECRDKLVQALIETWAQWAAQEKKRIEEQVSQMPSAPARTQLREKLERDYAVREKKLTSIMEEAQKVASWNPYNQNATADFFEPGWMFSVKEGFDIVIGNPPYGAKISKDALKEIKANLRDTRNSNSAALFIAHGKNRLMKSDGVLAFIVPKSLLFSKTWQTLAFTLSEKATVLVDVERAFKRVLLEQVVFVYSSRCETDFYTARKFVNATFTRTTQISRDYPKTFEAWICDVSPEEIRLGLKLHRVGTHLSKISESVRGLSVQKFLKSAGEIKVIGGRNISRYGIEGVRGFTDSTTLASANKKIQSLLRPKIISQNIVTAREIKATVDSAGDILGVDTVENTFITEPNFSLNFIAALFNATLVNWYAHRFIFCSAGMTMHFDNYYVGKIPVPAVSLEAQQPIIELVDGILSTKRENPNADVTEASRKIDVLVYALYGLTDEEIALVKEVMGVEG